jgi:phosphohistidine phosphatase
VTTRRLVLIRHAKSADGLVDIERPVAPRGIRDARAIGRWLADADIVPDRVVVSPARRARQTWEGAAAQLTAAPAPDIDDRIYDNEVEALLEIAHETPDDVGTLVLVGHNPSFGDLAYALDDGNGAAEAHEELRAGFRTSAIAVYDVLGGWPELDLHAATLTACIAVRG